MKSKKPHQAGSACWTLPTYGNIWHAGTPRRSKCDYSTVAQECSGIIDRDLHPDSLPAGENAEPVSSRLQLSLSQPGGVMLLSASTGARHKSFAGCCS